MKTSELMFYLLSGLIAVFSVLTITSRRILRAAVFLLIVLLATAGLYFMLNYQFLAGVQLTLYAGGIVVLIIFSILLTSKISHRFELPSFKNLAMGLLVGIAGLGMAIATIVTYPFVASSSTPVPNDMNAIGTQLIDTGKDGYALPFEVISILLLAAMVGAIVIAKKTKQNG